MKILLNNHRCDSLTESVQDNVVKSVWNDSIDVGERGVVVFNTFHRTALLFTDEEYAIYKEGVFSEKIKLILWQLGMLVSPLRDERKEWCQLYVEHKKAMSYIDLTVLLTQRCQMRCVYCFEGDKGKHDIQTETTDDILRFLATKTDECRRIRVTWFGGEPLIAYNRMAELSRRLIGFCTANAIEYSADMTTNAYSLDDRKCRELCKELHVGRFIVTLDGTKTVHDKRRPHVSGVSSFERIWHNICTLVSEGAFVTIRMTIDKDNADNIPQLLDHIASSELYGKVWGTERSVYESVGRKMGERFVFQRVRCEWLR